ncbi:translocation/assembly module TamB domain-containing protein [Xylanibacter oryzae]|uniref:translocation/assembly module TamB domain-containing protein n=1 Tax=Xylanibacter oryzae TaxID=185293 RepID=UPI0004B1FE6B|nr:translocation/assembly module TamB domain-containing protein [Xylanibacter oryzae]
MNIRVKKILKWTGVAILAPILLVVLLAILLYIPPIQRWAVKEVVSYASNKTGMNISVERVRLVFPLDLGVDGLRVIQQNDSLPQVKDTVADVKNIMVNVQFMPLLHSKVEIDALEFNKMRLNTTNLIHQARVKGTVGQLSIKSHGIDVNRKFVKVNSANMVDARLNVELSDTVPKDTTQKKNFWKISVDHINITNTDVAVHMPGDTLQVQGYISRTSASGGYFDLYSGLCKVDNLDWTGGKLRYDNNYKTQTNGLDYSHIAMTDVNIGICGLSYLSPKLKLNLRNFSFREKSGIRVDDFSGLISLDSKRVMLPAIHFRTPDSEMSADLEMDLNAFAKKNPGKIYLRVNGQFGKQDLMHFMGLMPQSFVRNWPNYPLKVMGSVTGNLNYVDFTGLLIKLPTAFDVLLKGYAANLMDMRHIDTKIRLNAHTYNIGFVTALLNNNIMRNYRIPTGIGVNGSFSINGTHYAADLKVIEGNGTVSAQGQYNAVKKSYQASLKIKNLQIHHFIPNDSLYAFTGNVDVKGVGFTVMSKKTHINAKANISSFQYGHWNLDHMKANLLLTDGKAHADINSDNKLLKGLISFDALLDAKNIKATISADLSKADLYRLRLSSKPLTTSLCANVDVASDLNNYYKMEGVVSDVTIMDVKKTYRPKDLVMDIMTNRDTTRAKLYCGNFRMNMNARGGYKWLLGRSKLIMKEMTKEFKEKTIDQNKIRKLLPVMIFSLSSGNNNPVYNFLKYKGYQFDSLAVNVSLSPKEGLNGNLNICSLKTSRAKIDIINIEAKSDSDNVKFTGHIQNNKKGQQYKFNALMDGYILKNGAGLNVKYFDGTGRLGLQLGAEVAMEKDGLRFHLSPENPIIGYKKFGLNTDNYLLLGNNKRVSAKIDLLSADGAGIKVYTDDGDTEALQNLTVSLQKFDLGKIMAVIPYMPRMTGTMNGDFHLIQNKKELSVSSDVAVKKMTYQGCPLGNVSSEFVYMPKEDGSHYVDGRLMRDDQEIATIKGSYNSAGDGSLDATLGLEKFPMAIVNGFVPNQLIGFKGYAEGTVTTKGPLNKPQVDGEVYLDSSYLVSVPYGVEMRFDNDPVRIVGSHLLFENFEMYSHNNNPLNISGYLDFSDMQKINMSLNMRAQNYLLIDSKENNRSISYGKSYVNFFGSLKGYMDNLNMRGKLDVLGSTDITYILRDSPLTTDNQLDELVKFVDLRDTTQEIVKRPPIAGLDMDLILSVNDGARIRCDLNSDHTNYVDLIGGGDLHLKYNPIDDIRITGRYTLNNGEMKYSLPVIPLKTFTIQDGSYIEFQGDPMNPKLDITAKERTKATVSSQGETGRSVTFDCGVIITKTLKNMGLQFTIDAPEDMNISNQLSAMSTEQRGKLAVTMLTTGMYLADGNTSGFSMNGALNSFLQGEINNIAGNAMRTLDLSIGMDNSTDASGNSHTDYSFKFAKRFWNNRMNIVVGGKVSTGMDPNNQDQSVFDNVTLEYRLDKTSNKYVKLFYYRNTYDWLEGETGEYGIGFVWRRKLQHFKDILRFKNVENDMPPVDSVKMK